jgi:hypothetical protein
MLRSGGYMARKNRLDELEEPVADTASDKDAAGSSTNEDARGGPGQDDAGSTASTEDAADSSTNEDARGGPRQEEAAGSGTNEDARGAPRQDSNLDDVPLPTRGDENVTGGASPER